VANDWNFRWVMDMGAPGPHAGKGGKHIILPPDWKGEIPAGYYTGQSTTYRVFLIIRSLPLETDQGKAALHSLFKLKDVAKTGAIELYFGPSAPAGKEGQWVKTNPGKGWFVYLRLYGPEAAAFDGSWKPGDFEAVS
jgi:hypothetical protein